VTVRDEKADVRVGYELLYEDGEYVWSVGIFQTEEQAQSAIAHLVQEARRRWAAAREDGDAEGIDEDAITGALSIRADTPLMLEGDDLPPEIFRILEEDGREIRGDWMA
jgi:hypothetical protein